MPEREKGEKGLSCFLGINITMSEKIKPVLPSLREKKRYMVFEILSKQKIDNFDIVSEAITNAGLTFLGQLGMAKAGMLILKDKWNKDLQKGMLRVNNKHVDNLKASLTLIENIDNKEVIVKSVGVSGIMKKAQNKFLKCQKSTTINSSV